MKDQAKHPGIPRSSGTRIIPATTPQQIEQVRRLFREYAGGTGACECFQGFAKEIAELPGQYGPPTGHLLLAEVEGHSAGCVAFRKLDEDICEMKRLHVLAEFRGRKLGRKLAEAIIAEARSIGYRAMRLDTLSSMVAAKGLYQALGFRSIPRYNDNSVAGAVHMELKL